MILSGRDNECKEQQESKHVEDKAGTGNSRALEKGRIIRKPTIPVPVFASRRRVPLNIPNKNVPLNQLKFSSKCSTSTQTEDVGHVILTSVRLNCSDESQAYASNTPKPQTIFFFCKHSINIYICNYKN